MSQKIACHRLLLNHCKPYPINKTLLDFSLAIVTKVQRTWLLTVLTGAAKVANPAPNPVTNLPANNKGLNSTPVVEHDRMINIQPMARGKLFTVSADFRPIKSANHPATGAPNKAPTGIMAYRTIRTITIV